MREILLAACFLILAFNIKAADFDYIVDKNGNADFSNIQEAFDAVPDFRKTRTRIYIKNGVYKEKLTLPASKTNVTIIGECRDSVLLTYDDYASKKNSFGEDMGTTGSSSFFIFADGFIAKNISFENSSGPIAQAVAVRIDGDQVAFLNCRFLGFQDTLYPHGNNSKQYYANCYIEGTVDFIFGWSTAYFDHCTIFCKSKGYITAPSTEKTTQYGFVFRNCKISGSAPKNSVYLGRPWRDYGKSVFLNCDLPALIHTSGWHNWEKPEREKTAFFAEYNNYGEGANIPSRANWTYQLSEDKANKYTPLNVLGDWISELMLEN